ncbi:MAG: Cof-type HAD-IIB family hydrolase [Lachnospiraceae bacterium]
MYKMIVLDLDDTLLKNDGTISEKTKEALEAAQKKGVHVVLASGRPTFAMEHIARELKFEKYGGYILSFNGAKILDFVTKNHLFELNLTMEHVHELHEMCKEKGAYIQTYIGDTIVASEHNKYTDIEKQITGMEIYIPDDFKTHITTDVVKVIVLQDPDKLKELEAELKEEMEGKLYMTISKPFFLEFMNKEVDKSKSILRLIDMLDISVDEVIAIGDSYNDLSMVQTAGLGVAMENAVDEVKKVAKYITLDNENDGVAHVVEKFVLS